MKINITPNKQLFALFLLINAAGYDYEGNSKGIHSIRRLFRKKVLGCNSREIKKIISLIRRMSLPKDNLNRLANLALITDRKYSLVKDKQKNTLILHKWREISPLIRRVIKSDFFKSLFEEYCIEIEKLGDVKPDKIRSELGGVLRFFNLSNNIFKEVDININLLDSYNRGTNYYVPKGPVISCSLNTDNKISLATLRHEFIHLILKKIFKDKFENNKKILPVNKNYSQDNFRVNFDENFVLVANLFFIGEEAKRKNNLKFFYTKGFKKINLFYNAIEKNILIHKKALSPAVLRSIYKLI